MYRTQVVLPARTLTSYHGDLSRFHWLQVGNRIYFVRKSSTHRHQKAKECPRKFAATIWEDFCHGIWTYLFEVSWLSSLS